MKKSNFLSFLMGIGILTGCAQEKALIAEGATLEVLASGYSFTEGPATDTNGNVYFTDQPNNRIHKWDADTGEVSVFMEPSGRSNGLYFDASGNLLAAADEKYQLWKIDKDKNTQVIADGYEGKAFNGPNDLWVHPKGSIYFTDPYYQREYWTRTSADMEVKGVYYLAPGATQPVRLISDLVQPNGIIGSPDGTTLYVADINDSKTYRFTINEDGSLSDKMLLIEMGSDGMTLDEHGNIYLTGKGVHVFSPEGKKLLHLPVPENWTANVTFGGKDHDLLFITAMGSVYGVKMNVHGAR